MMDALPFYHAQRLGYRINPFSCLDLEEWREIAVLPDAVVAALRHGWSNMQISGDKGHGKTTTLLRLTHMLAEKCHTHYEYIAPRQHVFHTNLTDPLIDVALIDEVQRLWPWEKSRLITGVCARGSTLKVVIGTHADFGRRFRRAGMALTAVALDTLEPPALHAILAHRLAYFALDPQLSVTVTFTLPACAALLRLFGGDLRSMEPFLYDVFTQLDAPRAITPEMIAHVAQQTNVAAQAGRKSNGKVNMGF